MAATSASAVAAAAACAAASAVAAAAAASSSETTTASPACYPGALSAHLFGPDQGFPLVEKRGVRMQIISGSDIRENADLLHIS